MSFPYDACRNASSIIHVLKPRVRQSPLPSALISAAASFSCSMEYNNTYNGYTPFSVNGQYQQLPQTYYVAPPQPQTPYTAAPPYPVPGAFPYQAGPPIVRKIGEGTGVTRQLSRDDNGYSTRMPTRSHTMPAPGYTLPDQTPQPNGKRSSKKHRTYRRKTRFSEHKQSH